MPGALARHLYHYGRSCRPELAQGLIGLWIIGLDRKFLAADPGEEPRHRLR